MKNQQVILVLSIVYNADERYALMSCFSTCWKYSRMFPVCKKVNKCDIITFRGITSLCVFKHELLGKTIEFGLQPAVEKFASRPPVRENIPNKKKAKSSRTFTRE